MSVSIAAEWNEMYNRFYRKREIYTMSWQGMELRHHVVACAPFGGPIATVRDERKLLRLGVAQTLPRVHIFTASGVPMASFPFDRPGGRLVAMGWTEEEVLMCLVEDGSVYQYSVLGEAVAQQVSLGKECWEQGVRQACLWGSGLVALTQANQLFAITDLKDPRPVKLPGAGLTEAPHCMAVIEPQFTLSGQLEVLLAVGSTVLVVDPESVQDQGLSVGPVQALAVAPNGSFLAAFTSGGKLRVLTSDFTKTLSEFDTKSESPPDQMVWCGVDSVLLYWEAQQSLLMVGPYGDWVRYSYDDPALVLIQECDGVRIVTNAAMEFLSRVPDSMVELFRIGSTAPAALLLEALEHFDRRLAKADENIRLIGSALPEAVETCIDAAGHEFDPALQKTLLRAAAYGRAFCRAFPRDRFRDMCKALRVLNAVRHYETAGIPLSYQQYQVLTPPVLVARLVNAHRHLLALRVARSLDLPEEKVLRHWASAKVAATTEAADAAVLELLVSKLKSCARISYAAIAANAHKRGRARLAAMLLDFEPHAAEQVPLLTSMGEDERALVKALESGDTDLVFFAIFHLWRTRPEKDVIRILQGKPAARDLFVPYAKQNEPELLKRFYTGVGQPQGVAEGILREAWAAGKGSGGPGARGSALGGVRRKLLEQAAEVYSQTREHGFHAKAAQEQAQLLKAQQELEVVTGEPLFVDSSVSDSIRTCIALGNHRAAQKLRSDFKVPDKRFYWLKIKTLAVAKDWEALEKFAKEKKPPVGFKPFVEACMEEGANSEAAKYIPKLTDPQERAEAFARIGMVAEAAEAAAQAKDGELLGRLKSTFASQNIAAAALFDSLRDRLSLPGMQSQ